MDIPSNSEGTPEGTKVQPNDNEFVQQEPQKNRVGGLKEGFGRKITIVSALLATLVTQSANAQQDGAQDTKESAEVSAAKAANIRQLFVNLLPKAPEGESAKSETETEAAKAEATAKALEDNPFLEKKPEEPTVKTQTVGNRNYEDVIQQTREKVAAAKMKGKGGKTTKRVEVTNVSKPRAEAEIVIPENTHPLAAELLRQGYLIVDPNPINEAESIMQGQSLIAPIGYRCVPVKIRATVNAIQGYPGRPGTHILLPCFMDVMDTTEVACAVTVYHGSKKVPHKANIVYSQPTKDAPRSPIVSLTEIEANSTIVVEALHWVNIPVYREYPDMTQDAIKKQLEDSATLLGDSVTSIYSALDTGRNVKYNSKRSGFDTRNILTEGADCTGIAAYTYSLDPNHLVIIEGFAKDGPHAMCMGKIGKGENTRLFYVDPKGGNQHYVGPSKNYPNNYLTVNACGVVTISDEDIQSWKGESKESIEEEVELKGSLRGINRGLFYRVRSFEKATASYVMNLETPSDIQLYAETRAKKNQDKYPDQNPQVAGGFNPITQERPNR